jgi:Mn2+/Fe2+ NRAMP family transporter
VVSAFVCKPPAGEVVHNILVPVMPAGGITGALMFLVIAIVGTTIAPCP